jgi:hypothetical protein
MKFNDCFSGEHSRERTAVTVANDDDHLALAGLVFGEAAIRAVRFQIGGLYISSKISGIDFGNLSLSADHAAFQLAFSASAQAGCN